MSSHCRVRNHCDAAAAERDRACMRCLADHAIGRRVDEEETVAAIQRRIHSREVDGSWGILCMDQEHASLAAIAVYRDRQALVLNAIELPEAHPVTERHIVSKKTLDGKEGGDGPALIN